MEIIGSLDPVIRYINKIKQPAIYQGKFGMKNYFEGWYFKIVDSSANHIYAVIPGVSFDKDGNSQAFIQFFDGKLAKMDFISFPINQFSFNRKEFCIKIGNNEFNSNFLSIGLSSEQFQVSGKITFRNLYPWPISLFSPGVMGWYRYVPKMECYHGVISMDHHLEGSLTVNGREVDFTEGKGYIEKDYGRSFPRYYIWGQSNHFETPNTSVMVSFAKIPWFRSYFDGFIAGFLFKGKLYRFATYTGARVCNLDLQEDEIRISIIDKQHQLDITAVPGKRTKLPSPIDGSMIGRILESITGEIHLNLLNFKTKEVIFAGVGKNAGIDIGGNVEEIPRINLDCMK